MNVKSFLLAVEKELHISDWASVTTEQLSSIKYLPAIVEKYGGVLPLINKFLPERNLTKQKTFPEKVQQLLESSARTAFPKSNVASNYKLRLAVKGKEDEEILLDVYIQDLNVAFEYQGEEFFQGGKAIFGSPEKLQQEFRIKQQKCKTKEIRLIEVPYWWNITPENLKQLCK